MDRRVLITIAKDEIAPRFDLATEALLMTITESGDVIRRKSFLLARASGDELCDLALSRDIGTIVCGAIEDEYYHYLRLKRIEVIDFVAGPLDDVLARLTANSLRSGDILYPRFGEGA
jgi:hypothetical protein